MQRRPFRLRGVLSAALAGVVLTVVMAGSASACSLVPPIDVVRLDDSTDSLYASGINIPPDATEIVGAVEYTNVKQWSEQNGYARADALAPTRLWGTPPPKLESLIRGGRLIPATTTTTSCPPDLAQKVGDHYYLAVWDTGAITPIVETELSPEDEGTLVALFGQPTVLSVQTFPAAHPYAEATETTTQPQVATNVLDPATTTRVEAEAPAQNDSPNRTGVAVVVVGLVAVVMMGVVAWYRRRSKAV